MDLNNIYQFWLALVTVLICYSRFKCIVDSRSYACNVC